MNTDPKAFAIALAFLRDHESLVPVDEYTLIRGWIRSRSVPKLADALAYIAGKRGDIPFGPTFDVDQLRFYLQMQAFFKKNEAFTSATSDDAALQTFLEGEEDCRYANYWLERHYDGTRFQSTVSRMQHLIAETLGDPLEFLSEMKESIRFTSGATTLSSRRNSLPFMKVSMKPRCPTLGVDLVKAFAADIGYTNVRPRDLNYNRVEFVPKNWKTSRTIACEPEGILPFQLAFDSHVKRRLRKVFKIDLSDQSVNQQLAIQGSVDDSLATIDLSRASDTISVKCIELLFPEAWASLLMRLRSPLGKLPNGDIVKYEKFASMGNGATFALETLVFAACCRSLGPKVLSVYGDDIVIDSELYPELCDLLTYLGFTVNADKSFASGPFRESCGVDSYRGIDITPFYLRKEGAFLPSRCQVVNGLVKIADPGGFLWQYILDLTVEGNLPLVPESEDVGTGVHIHMSDARDLSLIRDSGRIKRNPATFIDMYKGMVPKTRKVICKDSRALFLWHLTRGERHPETREGFYDVVSEIGRTTRYSVPTGRWNRKWLRWSPPEKSCPKVFMFGRDLLSIRGRSTPRSS